MLQPGKSSQTAAHHRYERLLTMVHSVNGASLLVGGPGTCKTTCVNQFLGKFNAEVRGCVAATCAAVAIPDALQAWALTNLSAVA
jgi:dynein heavy chain